MTTDLIAPVVATGGVILTPRPFAREEDVTLHALPDCLTIAEMIASLEADGALDAALRPWVRVTVGHERIAREDWATARPLAGDTVVVDVAPMASSNPVRAILQIAVLALSAFVGYTIGGLPGAIASTAINIAGIYAINAIAPIKQPEQATRDPRYSLSGGSNAATPHEAIPIVMGRRRLYPPRCANWYTRTVANVVYLRMMFQPCMGWVDHEDPRIGQTSLSSYDGVTARWRTRPDEVRLPIWFDVTPMEDSLGVPVTADAGWVTRTAPMEADTLSIDIAFMAGLFETKESSGNPKNRSVTFEFRYGPRGGDPAAATACPFTVGGLLTFTRDDMDSYREGHDWVVARGEYDVHIRRVSAEAPNARITDELTWVCLRAFRNEAAVRDLTGVPWIELEIKATEQLQGVPDDFNFIATSMVRQATADGPGEDWIVSRNPADLYLAASDGPFSDIALDEDERNFAAIAAWRAVCAAEGWTCDLAEQGELSVGELLQRCAATGRSRASLDFGALSVVVDWAKPAPKQMFTARNVAGFQGELVYPTEVHGLRLRFQNEQSDYQDDLITVFAEGYDLDTATLYESLDIRDKTDPDQVEWEGARLLAERKLRPETFSFDQDVEYLTAVEGARAWLAHHVALVGQIAGRVKARVVDAEDPTRKGLRLDEMVVMEEGRSYDLAWRSPEDVPLQVFALETVAGQSDIVWFAMPAPAVDDQPEEGDLVTVFEHAVELLDVVIDRIKPKEGMKARITCVPYAPELQTIGEAPIPAYRTGVSRPPGLAGAIVKRRTDRGVDQAIQNNQTAVEEAGKGVEAINDGTGLIAGRTGTEIVGDLDINAAQILAEILRGALARDYIDARTYLGGIEIGTVLLEEREQRVEGQEAFAALMDLLGAASGDSSAFILNTEAVKVSPTQSLATFLTFIESTLGDGTVTITELREALNGQEARVALSINANGHLTGYEITSTGGVGEAVWVNDRFKMVDPDDETGATAIIVMAYEGGRWVLSDELYVRKIVAESIYAEHFTLASVETPTLQDNSVTNRIRGAKSTVTSGTGFDVTEFTYTFDVPYDADVEVDGNANFLDGGGNGPSYHSSAIKLLIDGVEVAVNSQPGANAMTQLSTFGGAAVPGGEGVTCTVAMTVMTKPDDDYDRLNFRVRWFFK
jgi:hypothetical protein